MTAKRLAPFALLILLAGLAVPVSGSDDALTLGEDLLLTAADFESGRRDGECFT